MKSKFTERELTAYHEAGHAMFAQRVTGGDGLHLKAISIIPNESALGSINGLYRGHYFTYPLEYTAFCLAGCWAERQLYKRKDYWYWLFYGGGSSADYQHCCRILDWHFRHHNQPMNERMATIELIGKRLTRYFRDPDVWAVVTTIASALLEQGYLLGEVNSFITNHSSYAKAYARTFDVVSQDESNNATNEVIPQWNEIMMLEEPYPQAYSRI